MPKAKRHAEEEDVQLDMTPMLDVVFIMLIFFIVTAVFVKEAGVDVLRPEADTAIEHDRVSILVAVTDEDEIWINRQQVDSDEVRATVEKLQAENPLGTTVIQADEKASAGLVIQVMEQIRNAGVPRTGLSTLRE